MEVLIREVKKKKNKSNPRNYRGMIPVPKRYVGKNARIIFGFPRIHYTR